MGSGGISLERRGPTTTCPSPIPPIMITCPTEIFFASANFSMQSGMTSLSSSLITNILPTRPSDAFISGLLDL
jgi:hypothetical protein